MLLPTGSHTAKDGEKFSLCYHFLLAYPEAVWYNPIQ